jgi:hypothetical protein
MKSVIHNFFRRKLYKFTNRAFDIISTIDHPYASPPVRLIDGHAKLKALNSIEKSKTLLCIWDVNFPNINNYRYDLAFDAGILSIKNKKFFLFSPEILYPLQKPSLIDFSELNKRLQLVLENLWDLPRKPKIIRDATIIKNFNKISDIYVKIIKKSNTGTDFYQHLLEDIYLLLGLSDLATFIKNSFYSYFGSALMQKWIPFCINETKNKPYGFLSLLETSLFKKPYFRSTKVQDNNIQKTLNPLYIKKDIDEILELIRNNTLIPSYEILFWTLFLANIKHFGNDYDFFARLEETARQQGFLSAKKIQITRHNQDSQNIILFEKDKSFGCLFQNGNYFVRKNSSTKNSRIVSLTALYCHLGEKLGVIVNDLLEGRINVPQIIKMGRIAIP